MIYIVNCKNRLLFESDLTQMHRQRKAVFIDTLGWHIPATDGLEIDAYDRPNAIYLLAKETVDAPVLASARLLPTTSPHLMSDLFPHLCASAPPTGPAIWEASRFCPAPQLAGRARLTLLWHIFCGIMETAQRFRIQHLVFTANAALLPLAMQCGWHATAIGATQADGDDQVTPVLVRIDTDGLTALRRRFDIPVHITRYITPAQGVAA